MTDQPPAVDEELLTVHPAAAAFPMLSDDELLDLAKDIAKNGLIHAIMLTTDGTRIVDGRNRRRACRMAEVPPRYDRLPEGVDPIDYIYSANINRRHLTKGQQAILVARLRAEETSGRLLSKQFRINVAQLSEAREIVSHPDLADLVLTGGLKFDIALRTARDRTSYQQNAANHMHRLRNEAPDLATLVDEEKLTLVEAASALDKRLAEAAKAETELEDEIYKDFMGTYGLRVFASAERVEALVTALAKPAFRERVAAEMELTPASLDDMVAGTENLARGLTQAGLGNFDDMVTGARNLARVLRVNYLAA